MTDQDSTEQETAEWLSKAVSIGAQLLKNALPSSLTREVVSQQFEVAGPTTVFVKATGCRVTVRRRAGGAVRLDANLYVSAGLDVATQQDAAGIYIVILRKRVLGAASRSRVQITLPPDCDLVADLEQGDLLFEDVSGRITVPGSAAP
ncbi:MAG: hypothetical protein JXB47_00530 [Anaerolineae bacterium]|nr:hypothetical protein [Anaerolineae bacterium]